MGASTIASLRVLIVLIALVSLNVVILIVLDKQKKIRMGASTIASLITLTTIMWGMVSKSPITDTPLDVLALYILSLMYIVPYLLYFFLGSEWLDQLKFICDKNIRWPKSEVVMRVIVLVLISFIFSFPELSEIVQKFLQRFPPIINSIFQAYPFYTSLSILFVVSVLSYSLWHVIIRSINFKILSGSFKQNDLKFFIRMFLSLCALGIYIGFFKYERKNSSFWVVTLCAVIFWAYYKLIKEVIELAKPDIEPEKFAQDYLLKTNKIKR